MRSSNAILMLASCMVAALLPLGVFGGAYVPFDPTLWTLPAGFKVQKYYTGPNVNGVPNTTEYGNLPKARSIAVSGNSKLFGPHITYVSTKGSKGQSIYALVDKRGRGQADYAFQLINFTSTITNTSMGAPNAIAWNADTTNGTLYILVSSYWVANRLYKINNVDNYALKQQAVPWSSLTLIRDDFPMDAWHGWRYMRFDKSKNLYIGIGANCNACDVYGNATDNGSMYSKAYDANMTNVHNYYQKNSTTAKFQFASIYKLTPPYTAVTGTGISLYASGVRNTVGFDFNPSNSLLYFTDNGRDDIGGANSTDPAIMNVTKNLPDCEFNVALTAGANYGFPFCHTGAAGPNADNSFLQPFYRLPGIGNDVVDPDLNFNQTKKTCNGSTYKRAIQAFGPHTAPLGMRWYVKDPNNNDKTNFPADYWNSAFVAIHGSWDRDYSIGARVTRIKLGSNATTIAKHEPFMSGGVPCDTGLPSGPNCDTKNSLKTWIGRPADIERLSDTTILVSDDEMGALYRIVYCDPNTDQWGSNAKYGVGRCGRLKHKVTQDKHYPKPITNPFLNLANGCQVNHGPAGLKTYKRCLEYDSTGRGVITNLAYNLVAGPNSSVIMDGAFVANDYTETNGNGWVAFAIPPNGIGNPMVGTDALIASPTSGGTGAAVTAYKLGTGAQGVAGFKAATYLLVNGSVPTAAMAGGAVVIGFQAKLPARFTPTVGGNLSTIISYGDLTDTGGIGQHWVIDVINVVISAGDFGQSAGSGMPVLNPALAAEPVYTPSCPGKALTAATCGAGSTAACLNGEEFNSVATLNDYAGTQLSIYGKAANGVLTVGLKANVGSYNSNNGYAVFCLPKGSYMTGNDCIFLRKYSGTVTSAANYVTDGYNGYQPTLPQVCTYSDIAAVESSPITELVGRFTMPFTTNTKFRFGGGAAPGGTGIDGMTKHPAGSPPYFGCIAFASNGGVSITAYPSITTIDSPAWSTTPCNGANTTVAVASALATTKAPAPAPAPAPVVASPPPPLAPATAPAPVVASPSPPPPVVAAPVPAPVAQAPAPTTTAPAPAPAPVGARKLMRQKRLTNIAVVKYKKHGKRFEIACYKNKVVNWRNGIEKDLDEVLQTTAVFSNVSKGVLAKREDLLAVFGTDDEELICKKILTEGELQVSDKERKVELDTLFRDVASVLSEKCLNPDNNRPYTISMLERALRDVHFSVDPKRPAKIQALEALPLLKSRFPIERARMRLKILVPMSSADELKELLQSRNAAIEEQDLQGSMMSVLCLLDPGAFRAVHALVQGAGAGGRVEVVALAATAGEADAAAGIESLSLSAKPQAAQQAADGTMLISPSGPAAAASVSSSSSGFVAARPMAAPVARRAVSRSDDSSGFTVLYPRGPLAGLPEEHASRKERFAELDNLQAGWSVELRSRGEGSTVEAVFYDPNGERVGAFATARRMALAASKQAAVAPA